MADTANIGRAAGVSGSHTGEPAIHPLYVRITHWINALAVLVMIGSGWQIYNASPLFPFRIPQSSLGGWLAGGLLWHFAAMWVLVVNGLVYVTLGFVTGRFRRKLLPIRPPRWRTISAPRSPAACAMRTSAATTPCRSCSMPAFCSTGVVIVLSGLAIWKPVQLRELAFLFGGYRSRAGGALLRHGGDRPVPGAARRHGAAGAKSLLAMIRGR